MPYKIKKKDWSDPELLKRADFEERKCMHVRMHREMKQEFQIMAMRMGITVQGILERLIQAFIDEDPYIVEMLNKYKIDLENDKLLSSDIDTVLRAIEEHK